MRARHPPLAPVGICWDTEKDFPATKYEPGAMLHGKPAAATSTRILLHVQRIHVHVYMCVRRVLLFSVLSPTHRPPAHSVPVLITYPVNREIHETLKHGVAWIQG